MSFLKTIILLSSFSILLGQSWMQKQRLERKFNQAVSNYDDGKYENCETILQEILSEDPGIYKEATLLLLMSQYGQLERAKPLLPIRHRRHICLFAAYWEKAMKALPKKPLYYMEAA